MQASPAGRYVLYLKNDHYWTVDLASGRQIEHHRQRPDVVHREGLGRHGRAEAAVRRRRLDARRPGVLLYDRLDIWEVKADGSGATRLTSGAAGEIRHRHVRLDPEEESDRPQPAPRTCRSSD